MRFLLDDSALEGSAESAFWRRVLPALSSRLEKHELYVLSRGSGELSGDILVKGRLQAPPPHLGAYRMEERRLSRLCRNMRMNAFVSTSCTNAGEKTPSLFVLCSPFPYVEQKDMPSLLARDRAIRSAALCVALDEAGAEYLRCGFELPHQRVRVAPRGDDATIAEELATSLLLAAEVPTPRANAMPWTVTKEELIAQFNAAPVTEIYNQLLQIPAVATQLDALHVVAWHCLTRRPETYLEFGMGELSLATLAAKLAPGIELYGASEVPQPPTQAHPAPTFQTAVHLMSIPQKSLGQYAVCRPAELLAELSDAAASPFAVDLTVIRPDPAPAEALDQLDAVQAHLSPRGALILTAKTPTEFSVLFDQVRRHRPELTYLLMQRGTAALALKAVTK